jgi:hypothetical protein
MPEQVRALRLPSAQPRAIDHVGVPFEQGRHQPRQIDRVVFEIGVLDDDDIACRFPDPAAHGAALARVVRLHDEPDVGELARQRLHDGGGPVVGAVVDHDDLLRHGNVSHAPEDLLDRPLLVEGRDYNADERARARPSRSFISAPPYRPDIARQPVADRRRAERPCQQARRHKPRRSGSGPRRTRPPRLGTDQLGDELVDAARVQGRGHVIRLRARPPLRWSTAGPSSLREFEHLVGHLVREVVVAAQDLRLPLDEDLQLVALDRRSQQQRQAPGRQAPRRGRDQLTKVQRSVSRHVACCGQSIACSSTACAGWAMAASTSLAPSRPVSRHRDAVFDPDGPPRARERPGHEESRGCCYARLRD